MSRICRMFCLTALAVASSTLSAQCKAPVNKQWIVSPLDAKQQETVNCLVQLNTLPDGEWRVHEGDIPHGESPTLDDHSWPVAKVRSKFSKEAVWYRQRITIPKTLDGYDLTGVDISFEFIATANGPMPEIIYFDGRRVALGEDLEQIPLFDHAKPGQSILVAVKLLPTVDDKDFRGAQMRITFSPSRPNPNDIATEIVSAANLLPVVAANSSTDKDTLAKGIAQIDLHALSGAQQAAFDASLRSAQTTLRTLNPALRQANYHLTGNSHIDAAWLWPWTETVDTAKRTFSSAVQLMNEYPTYTYTQSAAAYSQWIADKYPQLNAEIAKRVNEGRWELVGGMWVEPDLNMPDGESLVRQLLVGQAAFRKIYGHTAKIGWNPDSFGYTWQLPQIYKRSGIDYFVTQKTAWNDTNQFPFKLFWWESPDGSKVLTYFPHDYANRNLDPVRLSRDFATARERAPGLTEMMDLYGIGDHGSGPTRAILDEGMHWMEPDKIVPTMKFGTAQSFFADVEKNVVSDSRTWDYDSIGKGYTPPSNPPETKIAIPTWKSELYFEYHRGVMTTQAAHKRNMRNSEEWVLNAEKVASLAWLEGDKYPGDELTDAWKKVTFNDFHDLAAGSGIGIIYKEAQKDYDQVRWATSEISQRAIKKLSARIDTQVPGGIPILVFNPLAWERSGTVIVNVQMPTVTASVFVLDAANHVVPSQTLESDAKTHTFKLLLSVENVPSMGYKVLRVVPGAKPFPSDLKAEGLTLENTNLRVIVDAQSGCITSLYDKKAKFEALASGACGNQLQTFKDVPEQYDAWNIDPGTLDTFTPIEKADSVELIVKGPLRSAIRVTRTFQNSKFVQEIALFAGADQVEIVNDFDWHETHVLLKAAFPLAATGNKATYEIPYGVIERPTTRNNSWEKAQFEVPALRWADLGDGQHGFSLLNNSKYGYDAKDNVLRLSLLRSPVSPDPEADRGHQHFSYALYPHAGTWKQALTVRHGYEYNYTLSALQVQPHTGGLPAAYAYVTAKPENVVLTALKKAEDENALILRFYEWAGKSSDIQIHVPKGATGATLTNLMEKPERIALQVSNDTVTAPICRPSALVGQNELIA